MGVDFSLNYNFSSIEREKHAEQILTELLIKSGWHVDQENRGPSSEVDIVAKKSNVSYVVEVKVAPEGRKDRLIPIWSQAYLQAKHAVHNKDLPLAVVAAKKIELRVAEEVLNFAAKYAPDTAVGVIDFRGLRIFRGPQLEDLDSKDEIEYQSLGINSAPVINLFSDLNQWMLKVLLAPEIPEKLLSAPRKQYRNSSELAEAAQVSKMSAFRLVQQLENEGFLDRSSSYFKLVRRRELFQRWQSAILSSVKELPMRFILGSNMQKELKKMSQKGEFCLGLFAAADALNLGFVSGVAPYIYIPKLDESSLSRWRNLVPARAGELPDIILRQPSTPQSVFRGQVKIDEIQVCDIIQIWLDVSSHPSRGREQAEFIAHRALNSVIKGEF